MFALTSIGAAGFRGCRKSRLIQVSCVGAHGRAPYKLLIKQGLWAHSRAPYNSLTKKGLWAHGCAPLHASIKIKPTFATPSEAHGFDSGSAPCHPNCSWRATPGKPPTRPYVAHLEFKVW